MMVKKNSPSFLYPKVLQPDGGVTQAMAETKASLRGGSRAKAATPGMGSEGEAAGEAAGEVRVLQFLI